MPTLAILLVCLSGITGGSDDVPSGAVAVVDGNAVAADAYYEWLARAHGWKFLDEYLNLVLLEQEALRLGIEVTEADVDAALETQWSDDVLLRFAGDEGRFLAELAQAGLDKGTRLALERPKMHATTLARRIVLRNRNPSAAQLAKLHAELFGADGVRRHLQVAHFSKFRDMVPGDQPDRIKVEAMDADALKRAEAFLAKIRADPDYFGEHAQTLSDLNLVPRYDSMVRDLRERGGDLPYYRSDYFYGCLEKDLARDDLEAGAVLGPHKATSGYYVARVVRREAATLEDVKEELREIYRKRPVTPREVHYLKQRLRETAAITKATKLPALRGSSER